MSFLPLEDDRRLARSLVDLRLARPDEAERALAEVERRRAVGEEARLGPLLVQQGLLTEEQVRLAFEFQAAPPPGGTAAAAAVPAVASPPPPAPHTVQTLIVPPPASPPPPGCATPPTHDGGPGDMGPTRLDPRFGGPDAVPAAPEPALPAAGSAFGRYRLLTMLGAGGMGVVWKAWDTQLQRVVALKQIRGDAAGGDAAVDRFLREARLAAKLRHPNIIAVHDVGACDGRHYLTMDFVEGRTFDLYLDETRAAKQAGEARGMDRLRHEVGLLADVAGAVAFAHAEGIIHRDLKPANVLLSREERPHVMDFGLAKQIGTIVDGELPRRSRGLTVTGQLLGTPGYLSPEQASGDSARVGPRSDVWSLGVMLFEVLTGALPFTGQTELEYLCATLYRDPPPPRHRNRHVPEELEAICLKAMEKDAARRYPTAREFADELRRWLRGEPVVTRRPSTIYRTWRWAARRKGAVLGASAALLAVSVALGWAWHEHARRDAEARAARAADERRRRALLALEAARLAHGDARLRQLDVALEAEPDLFEALALRARTSWQLGFLREPLADLEGALRLRPGDPVARLLLFRVLALGAPGRSAGAAADLDALAAAPGDSPAAAVAAGHRLRLRGEREPALALFERARSADPRAPEAWCGLGWCRLDAGEWDAGLAASEAALKLEPEDPEACTLHAALLLGRCRYEEAAAEADQILARWPWALEAAFLLAEARRLLGDAGAEGDAYHRATRVVQLVQDSFAAVRPALPVAWDAAVARRRIAEGRARACLHAGHADDARPLLAALAAEGHAAWLLSARAARAAGRTAEEGVGLERAVAAGDPAAPGEWAAFLAAAGRTAEAAAAFDRALAAGGAPALPGRYVLLAEPQVNELFLRYAHPKDEPALYRAAERPLLRALDLDPRYAPARVRLAAVRTLALNLVAARAELDAAVDGNPRAAEAWRERGCFLRDHREVRDLARAEADLRQAVELEPGSVVNRLELGVLDLKRGRPAEALAAAEAALAARPDWARALKLRADALARLDRGAEAQRALDAWKAAPADAVASMRAFGLAQAYANHAKKDDSAREFYNRAIEAGPRTAAYYHFRGDTHLRAFRLAEALRDKAQAIRLEPGRDLDLYSRCLDFRAQPTYAAVARPQMSEAARLFPADPCALFVQGFGNVLFGQYETGYSQLARVTEMDPDFASAHTFKALAALRSGRDREAEEALHQAERLAPGNALAALIRACLLARAGRKEEAARALEPVGRAAAVSERLLGELRELEPLRDDPRYRALRGED